MKNKLILTVLLSSLFSFAQEETKPENDFNKWSIELNAGQNKAVKPFSTGYYSADPSKVAGVAGGINHFDLGVRYMFSDIFGLKVDFAQDKFTDLKDAGSLPFDTQQSRVGFQGVMNLGRILNFQSFTNRFGVLLHGGAQMSQFSVNEGANDGVSEKNGGVMVGITPQVRLAKWLALTADFTFISNVRQHLAWDGNVSASNDNLSGHLYTTSLGLTVYLGGKDAHADWYVNNPEVVNSDSEARKRIDSIETLMNDTDKDGVADYLDQENNTPSGIAVDTRGKFVDKNKNGVPDEMDKNTSIGNSNGNSNNIQPLDATRDMLSKGYVNIFFDVNKDTPNSGSTNNVYYIIRFLREYPDTNIKLTGYADVNGDENKNLELSQRRAQNLAKLIVDSGISNSRIAIVGQGVDTNYSVDSGAALELARRVSITIE